VAVSRTLALSILIGIIIVAMPWAALGLDSSLGRSKGKPITLRDVFKMHYNINMLSAARLFLFGARCGLPSLVCMLLTGACCCCLLSTVCAASRRSRPFLQALYLHWCIAF
jgi:hypothetical protein